MKRRSINFYDTVCPKCEGEGRDSSGDNLRVFTESGEGFCVAGHGNIGKVEGAIPAPKATETVVVEAKGLLSGETLAIPSRGLLQKTCEFFKYEVIKAEKKHIATWFDSVGNRVLQQTRSKDKDFRFLGNKEYMKDLYGAWLWQPDLRVAITITEGQIDCLSVAQAFDCKYPVVSLPNGVGSAADVIEKNMKYLSGFSYVVLAFDNDEAGRQATEECLKLFEPGKVRVAKWRLKDANELLKLGLADEIVKTFWQAVEYIPSPILTGKALQDLLVGYKKETVAWPWEIANLVINPIQIPAIYTVAALPGVGKTSVMAELIRYFISLYGKVGIISLEESLQKLVIKVCDRVLGTSLGSVENREFTQDEIDSTKDITEAIVTYDHRQYGTSIESILTNLPYIATSMQCKFIIFDNLSFSATGSSDDERRNIDKAMLDLKTSSTKYNYTLFNICHLNDDSKDDFKKATIRGSRGVFMYSDQVIYLGRDTENEDPTQRDMLEFYYKKDREFGTDTGKSFKLEYDNAIRSFKG